MEKLVTFCLTIFLFPSGIISAQDSPIEWKKIPLNDLQMTSFSKDTNASAVILCDFGESRFNDDLDIEYTRHLRIKILNSDGYDDFGTHSISIHTEDKTEYLDDLEAYTYYLDEKGDIKRVELDDDEIFKEKVSSSTTRYKFTMPALRPGCVVEIRYKILATKLWFMRDWIFQTSAPTLWSEYRMLFPKKIAYSTVNRGYESWTVNESADVNQVFRGRASAYLGSNIVNCTQFRWVLKDAPALRDEPFITTLNDYANKVEVQLAGYAMYGGGSKTILTDWKTLIKELIDSKYFGKVIEVSGSIKKLTNEVIAGLTAPDEKLEAIFNWVSQSIVWTGVNNIYAYEDVDYVIKNKKGNSAEITFLLLSMLKSQGITGDPVILSTRSNGKIQELYPLVSQFNYVIAKINIGSKVYLVDATNPFRPMDLLPVKVLNVKALVVKQGQTEWMILSSKKSNTGKTVININLLDDGSLNADFEDLYGEYRSLSIRTDMKDKNDIDVAKELYNTDASGFNIDSVIITDKDNISKPFRIQALVNSSDYSQQGGDFIYINPTIIHRMTDNPFKSEVRKFPVDYAYSRGQTIVTNITIPFDYEVKEKYENKSYVVGNSTSYKRNVQVNDNLIQIISRIEIKEPEVKAKYYSQLKNFYSQIIAAQSEMLVIGPKEITTDGDGIIKVADD